MSAAEKLAACPGCNGRPHVLTGAEELRKAVAVANGMRESFNDRFTAVELVTLWRALHLCEWDITPDQWSPRQVREALRGIVPDFREPTFREVLRGAKPLPCGLFPKYAPRRSK